MLDEGVVRNGGQTPRGGITAGNTGPEPAGAFSIVAPIDLQVRVAAAQFVYSDLFSAARRRPLHMLAWVVVLLLVMIGVSSWQKSARLGVDGFASRFFNDLFGLGGLAILFIVIPVLAYYAIQPALVRGRLRRWCRDEQLDQAVSVTYRFEPDGLTVVQPGRTTVLACSRIVGVTEGPAHLYIRLRNIEDAYALPLRVLSAEQVAHIKRWAASCHAGAGVPAYGPSEEGAASDPQALLASRFTFTEEDRAIALGWQMERPGMRRRRRRGFALAFLLTALIVPLFFCFLWLLDPERVPFRYAFPLFIEMFASTFWQYAIGFWALLAVIIVLQPWAQRRHAWTLARRLQKQVPAEACEVRLYEDRLDIRQEGWRSTFDMASFDGIERRDSHLIAFRPENEPLFLPLRVLDDDNLSIIERVIGRRAGEDALRTGQNA
ncbi:YcxB family protein [Achromobacter sp. RTa]|uniref:YcxB family protein n=1 Tax=Achromobacter sp. RTa TaxID=1532557 RepID=UPI0012E07EE0|nr:YcxB family protein [Achromobacter sp. RTa]